MGLIGELSPNCLLTKPNNFVSGEAAGTTPIEKSNMAGKSENYVYVVFTARSTFLILNPSELCVFSVIKSMHNAQSTINI